MKIAKCFLIVLIAVASSWSHLSMAAARDRFTGAVPTLQSFTNESMTIITTLRDPLQDFVYEIVPKPESIKVTSHWVGHKHVVDNVEVSGLDPLLSYELIIKDKNGKILDARYFQSIDNNKADPKTAVCSCYRLGKLSPDDKTLAMGDRVFAQNPDAVLFLGDIIYGDNAIQAVGKFLFNTHPTFQQIQKRFITSWKKDQMYRQRILKPVFALWDDHDFGFEASDKTNPYKDAMRDLFRSYYPMPKQQANLEYGPGLSYSFKLFGKKILMLDNRSFFSVKDKTLLGREQIRWIESQIKNEKEVVIGSGMAIVNMGEQRESVERDAPSEWAELRAVFRNSSAQAVFLTGDVHYSEVRNVPEHVFGYPTLQVVVSPLRSTPPWLTPPFRSGKSKKDPNQLLHVSGYNFAILKIKSLFKSLEIKFHRAKNLPPVEFISSQERNNECRHFYTSAAGL